MRTCSPRQHTLFRTPISSNANAELTSHATLSQKNLKKRILTVSIYTIAIICRTQIIWFVISCEKFCFLHSPSCTAHQHLHALSMLLDCTGSPIMVLFLPYAKRKWPWAGGCNLSKWHFRADLQWTGVSFQLQFGLETVHPIWQALIELVEPLFSELLYTFRKSDTKLYYCLLLE